MGLVGTPHVARIALGWQILGPNIQALNVFHVQDNTDNLFSNPAGFCAQVGNAANTALVAHTYNTIQYNLVEFEDVRSVPFGGVQFGIGPYTGALAVGATGMPGSNSLAIKKSTGALGRSGRGRWYWPIQSHNDLDSVDTVSTARVNEIKAALAAFQAAVEGGAIPCKMGIVSYQVNKVARPQGFFQQITSWDVSDRIVDVQRRRLSGRGS